MTVRRDLTKQQLQKLREMSASGKTKAAAAKALGVGHGWIDKSAMRLGIIDEINRLFPRNRNPEYVFNMDEAAFQRLAAYKQSGMTQKEACNRLGYTAQTVRSAALRAGRLEEFKALFPENAIKAQHRRPNEKPRRCDVLPRDVDPAVQWLTKPWRKAA